MSTYSTPREKHDPLAVAIAHTSAEQNVRFAANKLTTVGDARRTSLSVVVAADDAVGTARGDVTSIAEAEALVARAESIAARSRKAADAFTLPECFVSERFEATAITDSESGGAEGRFFDQIAPAIDTVFKSAATDALETFGYGCESRESVHIATSAGLRDAWSEEKGHFGITAKTAGWERSVWSGQTTRGGSALDPPGVLEECRKLLALSSERREVDAGRYDVVLTPSCVADMLTWMYWLMSLRDADEGKSVFSDRRRGGNRIGEAIFPPSIRLHSDPDADGFECMPFIATSASHSLESVFDNGSLTAPVEWIGETVLKNLVSTREYASRAGVEARPFVANLLLEGDEQGGDALDLVKGVERGLLVNCLWYIRIVDPQTALLTGLTRDGVYLIEEGAVTAEVNNFRFNQSPVEMLANIEKLGRPVLATPREFDESGLWVKAPPALVTAWNMSTVSDAL